ncbi:MAG: hypothetical protein HQ559_12535 [Lentisphaerae bacterium]|nr:hypothetical protein [Lentisphaerota bacterium]
MKNHAVAWILVVLMGTLFLSLGLTGCKGSGTGREHPSAKDPAKAPPKDHPAH